MAQQEKTARDSSKLILIVDDDPSVLEVLEFAGHKEGFRIETAIDGQAALSKIQALPPDLIVLDLRLPGCGGFELLRRLQAESETAKIPIVVITGCYTDRTTAEMLLQEPNVAGFMEKPLKLPVLAMTLHNILQTRPLASGQAGETKTRDGIAAAKPG